MIAKIVIVAILFAAYLVIASNAYSQDPTASPTPLEQEATALNKKLLDGIESTNAAPAPAQTPAPAATPKPDFWHREQMTGDWDGDRERLKAEGFEMDFKLTQFYQGVAAGGLRRSSVYNGVFENSLAFNNAKAPRLYAGCFAG